MNVYDFDKTIYCGDSSVDFTLFFFLRHPVLIIFLPLQMIAFCGLKLHLWDSTIAKEMFFSFLRLKTFTEDEIELFWQKYSAKISPWYLKRQHPDDLIISASPEFLLFPLIAAKWNLRLIATKVSPETGKITGKNCKGIYKLRRLQENGISEKINEFYSDSYSDTPLAEIAEKAFLVQYRNSIYPEIKEWDIK